MKPKYTSQLILDYILGNDIEKYSIEELENDYVFMIEAIKHTKDKNLYFLCSENVKNNYQFIKFMVISFKSDLDFICDIADKFLEESQNPKETTELYILMDSLTEKTEKNLNYKLKTLLIYEKEKMIINAIKYDTSMPKEFIETLGNGFFIIYDNYMENKIILDFFAKKMIDELLLDNEEFNLEKYLHSNHDSFEEIEKIGINNFLIALIAHYDINLANYITTNIELLNEVKSKMLKIKNKWEKFNTKNNFNRVDYLLEKIGNYFEEVTDCNFLENDLVLLVAQEFKVLNQILDHPYYGDYILEKTLSIDKKNMSFSEQRHYLNVKKIFAEVFAKKLFEEPDSYIIPDKKESKIIEYDFQSKKRKI